MMVDRYAVIGNPVAHSRSPDIHAQFARQTGQQMVYDRLLAPLDGFEQAVRAFMAQGGRGLNVTLPFKLQAFVLANHLSPRAQAAGAVNTLRFDADGIHGDNTDGVGLVNDIQSRLACPLAGRSVLLLGAGGAARGVLLPLLAAGVSRLTVLNRTAARATELVQVFADPRLDGGGYERLAPVGGDGDGDGGGAGHPDAPALAQFDVIINATSASLGEDAPPVPPARLAQARLVYDMFYAARPTPLMRQATQAGCPLVSDGLGMLVEQAAESFLVWRGVRPQTAGVYAALRAAIDGADSGNPQGAR